MQSKKIIFSADDLGNGHEINQGILKGIQNGIITSTCLMANGYGYEEAVEEILPQIKNIGLGIHLDIIENRSLLPKNSKSLLCDTFGGYNNSYAKLLQKSQNNNFLAEVEAEFRSQIEKILSITPVDHINSHVHTHAIPRIFELTCRLAVEYKIPAIRTQYERNYFVPKKSMNLNYPLNLVKTALLNTFTLQNRKTVRKYCLSTNDNFVGIRYTGMMDKMSIIEGLKKIPNATTVEVLIHPYYFETVHKNKNYKYGEYLLTENCSLGEEIKNMGFEFSSFKNLSTDNHELVKN